MDSTSIRGRLDIAATVRQDITMEGLYQLEAVILLLIGVLVLMAIARHPTPTTEAQSQEADNASKPIRGSMGAER